MSPINPANVRVIRAYLHHLSEAEGLSEKTVDNAARVITEYGAFTKDKDFRQFKAKDAGDYRRHLLAKGGRRRAELSSRATVRTKLLSIGKFFRWLAGQPGYKSRITHSDVAHFNLSLRDARTAAAKQEQPTPTLEQVREVILAMPSSTDVEKRDRALMACMALTGIRVGAAISMRLKHVRPDRLGINHDPRDMDVKFAQSFPTYFFGVGADIQELFFDYLAHVRANLGWGEDHFLFPSTRQGGGAFQIQGLGDQRWKTAGPVWNIFRRAFAAAGISYFSPHSFRRMLVQEVLKVAQDPELIKILSQNLGHQAVLTTLQSYGSVDRQRQAERITALDLTAREGSESDALAKLREVFADPAMAKLMRKLDGND